MSVTMIFETVIMSWERYFMEILYPYRPHNQITDKRLSRDGFDFSFDEDDFLLEIICFVFGVVDSPWLALRVSL